MTDTTLIRKCSCNNSGQDSLYGSYMRLWNQNDKKEYTCTVCNAKHREVIVKTDKKS